MSTICEPSAKSSIDEINRVMGKYISWDTSIRTIRHGFDTRDYLRRNLGRRDSRDLNHTLHELNITLKVLRLAAAAVAADYDAAEQEANAEDRP